LACWLIGEWSSRWRSLAVVEEHVSERTSCGPDSALDSNLCYFADDWVSVRKKNNTWKRDSKCTRYR
jgi:hypothetical protein